MSRLGDKDLDNRYIFLADFGTRAIININRRDVELTLIKSQDDHREPKIGDRSVYRYRGKGIEVTVKYVVTGVCAPENESCEVTHYDATITTVTPSAKRTIRAHANCGT